MIQQKVNYILIKPAPWEHNFKMIRSIFLYVLMIFICGCTGEPVSKDDIHFFDLKNYFNSQQKNLAERRVSIDKTINRNGITEHRKFELTDWEKELRPFQEADINKPAWKKSYRMDAVSEKGNSKIVYTSKEEKLAVKKMEISFRDDTVTQVHISIEKKNSYYLAQQELEYTPGKGYSISGKQKVIMGDSISYLINTSFIY